MISKARKITGIALTVIGVISIIAACIGFGIPIATTFNHIPVCIAGVILGVTGIFAGTFIACFEG